MKCWCRCGARVELTERLNRFWIWATLDNLKIASLNAMACAMELGRLRPKGKVQ